MLTAIQGVAAALLPIELLRLSVELCHEMLVMVVIGVGGEGLLATDEPGGLPVAEPLRGLGKGQAQATQALQHCPHLIHRAAAS